MPDAAVPVKLRVILPPVPVLPLADRTKALPRAGVEIMFDAPILMVPPFPKPSATTVIPACGVENVPEAFTVKLLRAVSPAKGLMPAAPTVMFPFVAERRRAAPLPVVVVPFPAITRLPAALPIVSDCAAERVPPEVFKVEVWMFTLLSVVVLPMVPVFVTVKAVRAMDGASIVAGEVFENVPTVADVFIVTLVVPVMLPMLEMVLAEVLVSESVMAPPEIASPELFVIAVPAALVVIPTEAVPLIVLLLVNVVDVRLTALPAIFPPTVRAPVEARVESTLDTGGCQSNVSGLLYI